MGFDRLGDEIIDRLRETSPHFDDAFMNRLFPSKSRKAVISISIGPKWGDPTRKISFPYNQVSMMHLCNDMFLQGVNIVADIQFDSTPYDQPTESIKKVRDLFKTLRGLQSLYISSEYGLTDADIVSLRIGQDMTVRILREAVEYVEQLAQKLQAGGFQSQSDVLTILYGSSFLSYASTTRILLRPKIWASHLRGPDRYCRQNTEDQIRVRNAMIKVEQQAFSGILALRKINSWFHQ